MTGRALIARIAAGALHHKASLASLLMRGLGVAAGFVVTFIIGRWYGPAANGQYAIVTQTAMFLSVIAVGGLDLAVAREFSRTAAESRPLSLATFLRSFLQTLGIAIVLSLLMLIGGERLLQLMGRDAVPKGAVGVLCIILLARTGTRFLAAMLRSQSAFVLAQAVEVLFIPLCTILALGLGVARTISEILWATAFAGVGSALIGLVASLRYTSRRPDAVTVSTSSLYAIALPLWGAAITQNLSDWYVLATISSFDGLYQAGLFRVAAQFASFFTLVSTGLYGTFGTQISEAYHRDDKARVAELAGSATRLSAVLIIPVAVLFVIFARQIMGVIGPQFQEGVPILQVLVVGQVGVALASPAALVLAITGHPRINFTITAVSAAAMLVIAPLMVQASGAAGVAGVIAAIMVTQNLVAHFLVRRIERIDALRGHILPQIG